MSHRTALALFAVAALRWSAARPQTASSRAAAAAAPRPLLDQYCVGCHNQKNATAGADGLPIDKAVDLPTELIKIKKSGATPKTPSKR